MVASWLALCVFVAAFLVVPPAWWPQSQVSLGGMLPYLVFGCVALPIILLAARKHLSIRCSLSRSGGLLCLNCAHDLGGLGTVARCPECGEPFDAEHTRQQWRRHVRRGW